MDVPSLSTLGSTPVPDPTLLTTAALNREIAGVQASLYREVDTLTAQRHREIASLRELIETRLDAMDKAIELQRDEQAKAPESIEKKVVSLRMYVLDIMNERTKAIDTQFLERENRARGDAAQVKEAVAAALQAAKEAVSEQNKSFEKSIDKSDAATTKQIDSLDAKMATATSALDRQLSDLKERFATLEALGIGRREQVTETRAQVVETRAQSADMRGVILMCVSLLAIAITAASFVIALS
jgi:hypothetical protein